MAKDVKTADQATDGGSDNPGNEILNLIRLRLDDLFVSGLVEPEVTVSLLVEAIAKLGNMETRITGLVESMPEEARNALKTQMLEVKALKASMKVSK